MGLGLCVEDHLASRCSAEVLHEGISQNPWRVLPGQLDLRQSSPREMDGQEAHER